MPQQQATKREGERQQPHLVSRENVAFVGLELQERLPHQSRLLYAPSSISKSKAIRSLALKTELQHSYSYHTKQQKQQQK
jgi:hypothetical protein